jgi:hypothetical protein
VFGQTGLSLHGHVPLASDIGLADQMIIGYRPTAA